MGPPACRKAHLTTEGALQVGRSPKFEGLYGALAVPIEKTKDRLGEARSRKLLVEMRFSKGWFQQKSGEPATK